MRSPTGSPIHAAALALTVACLMLAAATPDPATAFNPVKKVCGVAGLLSGLVGKACAVVQGGRVLRAGKKLLGGDVKGAAKAALGEGASHAAGAAGAALTLAAVGTWVLGGAKAALRETASLISRTTRPRLQSTWFSGTYWRMSGLAALLTVPFLFAAAIQALLRSDLALLLHAALGYLPLALLAVSIAAPLTMLLLAATDEMCTIVSAATERGSTGFLETLGGTAGVVSVGDGSPFLVFLTAALLAGAALAVSLELLVREAAVYVVVLMLPLAFAALVWPARRIWALRIVETLVALILAKFVIVAVLALAGGALGGGGITGMLSGTALVMLAALSPWVLLRLLPFAELAGGVSGALRGGSSGPRAGLMAADAAASAIEAHLAEVTGSGTGSGEEALPDDGVEAALGHRVPELERMTRTGGAGTGGPGTGGPGTGEAGAGEAGAGEAGAGAAGAGAAGADVARAGAAGVGADAPGANGSGASGPGAAGDGDTDRPDRIPGMDAMWQAEDFTWTPLPLGSEEDWPPTLWPDADDDDERRPDADDDDDQRHPDAAPLPPTQDPEDGRL